MSRRKKADPLLGAIERGLRRGQFVSYDYTWVLIDELGRVKGDLDVCLSKTHLD